MPVLSSKEAALPDCSGSAVSGKVVIYSLWNSNYQMQCIFLLFEFKAREEELSVMYSLSYMQTQNHTEHRGTVKITELEEETPISIVYES